VNSQRGSPAHNVVRTLFQKRNGYCNWGMGGWGGLEAERKDVIVSPIGENSGTVSGIRKGGGEWGKGKAFLITSPFTEGRTNNQGMGRRGGERCERVGYFPSRKRQKNRERGGRVEGRQKFGGLPSLPESLRPRGKMEGGGRGIRMTSYFFGGKRNDGTLKNERRGIENGDVSTSGAERSFLEWG